MQAEPADLQWVVAALLDNAIRFSPRGEEVEVRVWDAQARACLSVSDRGPGISPEVQPWLFQEFVVSDIRHHSEGLGLSLATARAVLEQLGGGVEAEAPACGATFRIDLPLAASPVAVA